jgi:hypothetical protein
MNRCQIVFQAVLRIWVRMDSIRFPDSDPSSECGGGFESNYLKKIRKAEIHYYGEFFFFLSTRHGTFLSVADFERNLLF